MDIYYGFRMTTFHKSQNSLGNEIVDFLAMDCDRGALVTAAGSTSVRRATLLDARDYGLRVEGPLLGCAQAGCTITVQDSLVLGSEETGVEIGWTDPKVTPEVLVSHSNAFGTVEAAFPPDEPFDDMRGILQSNLSQDVDAIGLGNGECIVRPPDGTVLDGAASDGGTIGARILYRYVDGTETEAPLWDPGFPCGAVVPGVNDDLAFSCENLHNRINAGTHGCTLPYDDPGPCPH